MNQSRRHVIWCSVVMTLEVIFACPHSPYLRWIPLVVSIGFKRISTVVTILVSWGFFTQIKRNHQVIQFCKIAIRAQPNGPIPYSRAQGNRQDGRRDVTDADELSRRLEPTRRGRHPRRTPPPTSRWWRSGIIWTCDVTREENATAGPQTVVAAAPFRITSSTWGSSSKRSCIVKLTRLEAITVGCRATPSPLIAWTCWCFSQSFIRCWCVS